MSTSMKCGYFRLMGTQNRIRTANDNAPMNFRGQVQGHNSARYVGVNAINERPSPRPRKAIPDMIVAGKGYIKADTTSSLKITFLCWLAALAVMVTTFTFGAGTGPKALSSLALLWAGLWSSYVSADHGRWRLSELSVITALGGLLGAVTITANYFGFGLTITDGLMLMSIMPLFIGYMLKSRICALASICASLIWAALSFAVLAETSNFMMFFPAIWIAQIFIATRIQSGMAIMLAVLTGYYWAANFILMGWSADNLPLTFAAAALFIAGTAHHRSGKAAEDKRLTGSAIHIYAGWIAAMIGAIGFQYFWISPDAVQNSTATLSTKGLGLWKGVVLAALTVIFCSTIIRYKHSQISLAGIFLVTAISTLLPMMLWFPSWTQSFVAAIPGVSAMPTIGILIGSAILAASLGMMLNGVRRHSPIMIAMGIAALFAEAVLLMRPDIITLDNVVIFIAGFLGALAVSAAIAGSSLSHQAPAPRLKHH